jgi:aminopeptidase YwaD
MNANTDFIGRFVILPSLLLVAAWTGTGCGDEQGDAGPEEDAAVDGGTDGGDDEPSLPQDADSARLAETLEALSGADMAGRLTGTASGDLAEQYVTDFLTEAGFEPETQDVEFPLYEVGSPAALAIVDDADAAIDSFTYFDEFREVDFSGSGSVTGALSFAGYGIVKGDYDSFGDMDLTGKVVAMLTGVPSGEGMDYYDDGRLDQKIFEATERGAAGIVFVLVGQDATDAAQNGLGMELWAEDKYGDLYPDLLSAVTPVAFVHIAATERLLGKTNTELQADPTSFDTTTRVHLEINGTTHEAATCRNVFGVLPGQDPELGSEVVIVGAHYDHLGIGADGQIFYGAGDNATGAAVVLEAAATMKAYGVQPKRTVLFALWCAEEQGMRGSNEYAYYGTPLYPISDTKLMIQVDYIGEVDGPYITNVDDEPIIAGFLGDETEDPDLPITPLDWGGGCASDDCIFLYLGVPTYRFIAYGDHHHLPSDTFDNLNLPMVERVADVVIRGIGLVAY